MNFGLQNITDATSELISDVIENFTDMIELVFSLGTDIALGNSMSGVNAASLCTQGLAGMILCCMAAKQIFTTYITETDGDPDMEPTQILVKYSLAMAVIWSSMVMFQIVVKWGNKFTDALIGSADLEFKNVLDAALGLFGIGTTNFLIGPFLLALYIIAIFIFAFKAGVRGAELAVFRIILPIMACDMITPSRERWNSFVTSFLVTVFGYSLQILLFRISLQLLVMTHMDPAMNFTMAFAFIWLAIVMPDWLKKFSYSSGLGNTAGRTGQSGAILVASFLRRG